LFVFNYHRGYRLVHAAACRLPHPPAPLARSKGSTKPAIFWSFLEEPALEVAAKALAMYQRDPPVGIR